MFYVIPWSEDLDLSYFYERAKAKGFLNNCSQKKLVDCFNNEKEKQVWILYFKSKPIGSVAAHSFEDVMGEGSYRIAARTCVLTDEIEGSYGRALRTIRVITEYQNPTSQFLIPKCIEWAPPTSKLYITSNESDVGTQRRVNNIFGPALEKQGVLKNIGQVFYRETLQTVWQLDAEKFLRQLSRFPKWQ